MKKPTTFHAPFLTKITFRDPAALRPQQYPFALPILTNDFAIEINKPLTILVGENGSGKSTILEAIASHCGFNLTGGGKAHLYESRNDAVPLSEVLRYSWKHRVTDGFFMRAESFYNFANYIDEQAKEFGASAYRPYGKISLHEQSHGEAFLSLFVNRFGRRGIYLLDEPEAALSPQRQLALIKVLMELTQSGDHQVIMATHSPMLMAIPGATLLVIDGATLVERDYRTTEHYSIMRRFLDNPDKFIAQLMISD